MKRIGKLSAILCTLREKTKPVSALCGESLVLLALVFALSDPGAYQAASLKETAPVITPTLTSSRPTEEPTATQILFTDTPQPSPTVTPLPAELLANREQTFGIIIGTILLVILLIGGSIVGISARKREQS